MADTGETPFAPPGNEKVPPIPPAVPDQGRFAPPGNNQPKGPRTDDDTTPAAGKMT